MNNSKRIISMLLAIVMLLGVSSIMAFAEVETTTTNQEAADAVVTSAAASTIASLPNEDVKYSADYNFVYSFGIFEMLENGYWQTEQVKRGEFATIVAKMLKANTAGYPRYGQSPYTDIDESHFAYSSVCYLTEIGLLNGDGNSEFRPNDPILVNEASKMIMVALGYKPACEITNGGFPAGYTTFALRQGIYNGLSLNYTNSMSAMEMSKMVRNAMEAYLMETLVYRNNGTQDVVVSQTKTLLTETYKVKTDSGVVDATYYSYLTGAPVDLEDEVSINGICYQYAGNLAIESMLGLEVNYYYMEDVSGYKRPFIAYCEPKKDKNTEYYIESTDVVSFTSDKLVYNNNYDREKTVLIDATTLVSYNGKPYYELSDIPLFIRVGNIKVITRESTGKAAALIIQEYYDGLFDRYNKTSNQVVFQDNMTNILPSLFFDSVYHTKLTLDGDVVAPEDLKKNDVITYSVSKDGEYINGFVSRTEISGTVTIVNQETYPVGTIKIATINGAEYRISPYCAKEITSGFTSDFQLTADGRILGTNASVSSGGNYGYLIKFASNDGVFDSTFRIRILNKQGQIKEYVSATKVNTNILGEEKQRSAQEIVNSRAFEDRQLVVYEVNSAGELKSIYQAVDYTKSLADPDSLDFGMYFDDTARYSNGLISQCAIVDSTIIFKVPFVDRDREEDYKVQTKADLANGSYSVQIYDIRRGAANVLVIRDKEPTKVANAAATLVVDKFSTGWDEEKQEKVLMVEGWAGGKYVSLKLDDDCSQAASLTTIEEKDIKSLRRGDVIQYEVGSNGYLYTYKVLLNYELRKNTTNYFEVNQDRQSSYRISNDELYTLFGEVTSVFDYFIVETTNLTDKKFYRAYPTNGINLYIYDTEKDEITVGEPFDIEQGSKVFIRTKFIDQTIDMLVIQ